MGRPVETGAGARSVPAFLVLTVLLWLPFVIVGPSVERALGVEVPIRLPLSALAAIVPAVAALILVWRTDGRVAAGAFLGRAFDARRIGNPLWFAPILLTMPAVMLLSYAAMRLAGWPLPQPAIPVLAVAPMFLVFFVFAVGEELGWQGYAAGPLVARWGELRAGLALGVFWALWHVVPLLQIGRTMHWIAWWALGTVSLRVILVWLYERTGRSVFAASLFHAMINLSTFLFPNLGSHYHPAPPAVILAVVAASLSLSRRGG